MSIFCVIVRTRVAKEDAYHTFTWDLKFNSGGSISSVILMYKKDMLVTCLIIIIILMLIGFILFVNMMSNLI